MEFIKTYGTDESAGEPTGSVNEAMLPRQMRSVYLFTYSQANLTKFQHGEILQVQWSTRFLEGARVLNNTSNNYG